ncbi:MAG: hypothetical protein Tsb004_23400 [Allomuricauda sp.]
MKLKQIIMGILISLLFLSCKCQSQEEKCNQRVRFKSLEGEIPSSICIAKNHYIREIVSKKDINNDGLNDFVLSHSKINVIDGDSLFVSIYTQKSDSSYILKKTLGNLYPVFLDDYRKQFYIKNSSLNEIEVSYSGMYPFEKLEFLKNEILLKIEVGAAETMELHFVYRKEEDNWFMEWAEYYAGLTRQAEELLREDGILDEFKPTTERIDFEKEEQRPIDEFDYFDWI